jgi:bifunctional enzyme CysN/CysC
MEKTVLRLVTTGSVDDGKSTLIGRLLYETRSVPEDQYEAVAKYSKKRGKEEVDLSFLLDGLEAEREQGITIDVAYRYFETEKRKFIVADTPGHEQYTRNMVTGASNSELALILVDAKNGVTVQSRRHAFLVSLLGLSHLVVVVNKMDLVDYSEERYKEIVEEYETFCSQLDIPDVIYVPVSALKGDNVVRPGDHTPWYQGPSVLQILETVHVGTSRSIDFRFPVQGVLRQDRIFRGYTGQIVSGSIQKGEEVVLFPSLKESRVKQILTYDGEMETAVHPQSIVLTLEDPIDVGRGDMIVRKHNRPAVTNRFDAMLCWMDAQKPLVKNKGYLLKHTSQKVNAFVRNIYYKVDVNTLHRDKSNEMQLNDIGKVLVETSRNLFADTYLNNKNTGSFILVDPDTTDTVAAGMIKSFNVEGPRKLDRETLWLTGLPCSGKTTIANKLEEELTYAGYRVLTLDGDDVRAGLNSDLGFDDLDRKENLRRIAHICQMLNNKGIIVIASFVSPTEELRRVVKEVVERLKIIFIDCSLEICIRRDTKGMYKKALAGEMKGFTGIQEPYEPPRAPYLTINTENTSPEDCIKRILDQLLK